MALREKETVVVSDGDHSSGSWVIALIIIALLILAFFYFGGFSALTGSGSGSNTENINVDTPDTIEVQPTTPQE